MRSGRCRYVDAAHVVLHVLGQLPSDVPVSGRGGLRERVKQFVAKEVSEAADHGPIAGDSDFDLRLLSRIVFQFSAGRVLLSEDEIAHIQAHSLRFARREPVKTRRVPRSAPCPPIADSAPDPGVVVAASASAYEGSTPAELIDVIVARDDEIDQLRDELRRVKRSRRHYQDRSQDTPV